jgi:hypothetical protein
MAQILGGGVHFGILARGLVENWWPLFVLACFLLAPMPHVLFGWCYSGDEFMELVDERSRGLRDVADFLTGVALTSGIGLPIILLHTKVIALGPMLMSMVGGFVIYISVVSYVYVCHKQHHDDLSM